jgi:hypothetical protein
MSENIEPKQTMQIAEYSATAAALSELHTKYDKVLFQVETTKGMKDAVAARKELRDLRVGLEKMRKEIKAPALLRCQLIDSEAKEITAKLTALEDPIDSQIKAEERRKEAEKEERERVERERVAAIRNKIDCIKSLPLDSASDNAFSIAETVTDLELLVIDESYAEFIAEAQEAKDAALIGLRSLLVAAKAREEIEASLKAEREELDRQRAELERQRAEIEAARQPEPETPNIAVAQEQEPAVLPDGEPDLFSEPATDANDLVSEFAGYTAMQFFALADKVAALGFDEFAAQIREDGQEIASGKYNQQIMVADWKTLAETDKRMALAAHACVSTLEGDGDLGQSVLRQQAA